MDDTEGHAEVTGKEATSHREASRPPPQAGEDAQWLVCILRCSLQTGKHKKQLFPSLMRADRPT